MRLSGILFALLFALTVSACSSAPPEQAPTSAAPAETKAAGEQYRAPGVSPTAFTGAVTEGNEQVQIDLSCTELGVIAVTGRSEKRLKFQVLTETDTYTYDLPSDGTQAVYPLQCGDGLYELRALENISETKYALLFTTEVSVVLKDEFQPFLRASSYVDYTEQSACVKKAAELAAQGSTSLDAVGAIYGYICETVSYDEEKAETVQSGYLPDPDEIMQSGTGICFDYAALAASMLRSQGIPTKMIFGYVSPDDLYHAWNMFYTDQTGWVLVEFEVKKGTWNRLDLTFAANGADSDFIGNGENYADLYCY